MIGGRALRRYIKELKALGRVRLREVRVKAAASRRPDAAKLASRCIKPLQPFCREVLEELAEVYTKSSIEELISESLARGLSPEVSLALASLVDPVSGDESLLERYLSEGYVNWDLVTRVINSRGFNFGVEELKALISQWAVGRVVRRALPRFLRY